MSRILFRLDYVDSCGVIRNYAVNLTAAEAVMMASDVLTDEGYVDPIPEKIMIERHYGAISTLKLIGQHHSDDNEWQALARKGSKIPAIKKCRDMAGRQWIPSPGFADGGYWKSSLGLKEAKDKVEAFLCSIAC